MSDDALKRIERMCGDKIPNEAVFQRKGAGGMMLDYVDSVYVIDRLNEIFGPLGWSDAVCHNVMAYGPVPTIDKNGNDVYTVTFVATVRLSTYVDGVVTTKEDSAAATKTGKTAGEAIENCCKESVTDALKRCARKFGKSLGLALYDKSKKDVGERQYDETGKAVGVTGLVEEFASVTSHAQLLEVEERIAGLAAKQRFSKSDVAKLKAAQAAAAARFRKAA